MDEKEIDAIDKMTKEHASGNHYSRQSSDFIKSRPAQIVLRLVAALRSTRAELKAETAALEKAAECRALNGSGDTDYWLKYFRGVK